MHGARQNVLINAVLRSLASEERAFDIAPFLRRRSIGSWVCTLRSRRSAIIIARSNIQINVPVEE